jgi:hypothetical protein
MLYTGRNSIFIENGLSYIKRDDFLTPCFSGLALKSERLALIVFLYTVLKSSIFNWAAAVIRRMLLCLQRRRDGRKC